MGKRAESPVVGGPACCPGRHAEGLVASPFREQPLCVAERAAMFIASLLLQSAVCDPLRVRRFCFFGVPRRAVPRRAIYRVVQGERSRLMRFGPARVV